MRQLLPILVVDIALLAVVGIALLVWLPPRWRSTMVPAVLTLGAMGWVVALHLTGLVIGVRYGLWVVMGAAIVSIIVRSWRTRWWQGLEAKRFLLAGLVVGAVPVLLALTPARGVGATALQPSSSNDAYDYVAISAWLLDHSILQPPSVASGPPAWHIVAFQMRVVNLRVGQELYGAAVAGTLGRDPIQTWYVVTAGWLLLLPGTAIAAFRSLGLGRVVGLLAGGFAAFSAVVIEQVFNSNSDAALGVAIAPLAVALVAVYVEWRRELPSPFEHGSPPLWLAAAAAAALPAVYTEYLPLLIPAVVLFLVARPPQQLARAAGRGLVLMAAALVLAPLAWYRSVNSFLLSSGISANDLPSPFLGPMKTVAGRVAGVVTFDQVVAASDWMVPVLVGGGALGVGLAVALSPARRLFACLLLSILAIVAALSSSLHYFPYGQFRAVVVGLPIAIMIAVAGYAELVRRVGVTRTPRVAVAALLACLVALGGVFLSANLRATRVFGAYDISHRHVDRDFQVMSAWAHRVAGPDGANLSVLVPDHFDQVWSMYVLRDLPKANFPFLYSDYTSDQPLQFNDGRLRPYAVVGADAFVDAAPGVVVGRTNRFLLLDLTRGSAAVALGAVNVSPVERNGSTKRLWMLDDPVLLVAHTPDVHGVRLTMAANPTIRVLPVSVRVAGAQPQPLAVRQEPGGYVVPLQDKSRGPGVETVTLDTGRKGKPPNSSDQRPLTVALLGVGR